MDSAFLKRFRDAFGQYTGLLTYGGFAIIIVFGSKYIQFRNTLDQASPETAIAAVVTRVDEITCTRSMNTSIQAFNVKQRCLDVHVDMEDAPGERVNRGILVEWSNVGSLAERDHVFVVPANTGIDKFLIVNASDGFGFFLQRYWTAGVALMGALMILLAYLIKRPRVRQAGAGEP